jgi:uncharacterized protein
LNIKKLQRVFVTSIIAFCSGYLFQTLHIFLPWLLGPMFVIMIVKLWWKDVYWPSRIRDFGLVVLGLQLGSSFTKEAMSNMVQYLPVMAVTTLLMIGFTILSAAIIYRFSSISLSSAMIGSFPGGLSQMVVLSEEIKDANEAVVTMMQMFRIILVISIVPWIVFHFLSEPTTAMNNDLAKVAGNLSPILWCLLIIVTLIFIKLGKKLHFPIPYLLAPLFASICFELGGAPSFTISEPIISFAQVCLGAHLGCTMYFHKKTFTPSLFILTFLSNVALIGFCLGMAEVLHLVFGLPFLDMFISSAPGGVAEMAITAMAVNADVSVVTSFHLFRILVILFIVSPVISKIIRKRQMTKVEV